MIKLYGSGSPNVLKILFMLGETGLPWNFRSVKVAHGEQFEADFVALNPNSKVPVIVDSEGPNGAPHTVFESGAILIYLAEKTGRFLPGDAVQRSQVIQWLMFQMASVGPMFGQALHFRFIAPPGNDYARLRYLTEVNRLYDVLDRQLATRAWVAGEEFSIADMAIFPWVGKYPKTLEIDMAQRPNVTRWILDIEARPGYQSINEFGKQIFKQGLADQKTAEPATLDRFFGRAFPQTAA